MGPISFTHILLLALVGIIFFGPSRVPRLGQSIGKAIRGFKKGLHGDDETRDVTQKNSDPSKHD